MTAADIIKTGYMYGAMAALTNFFVFKSDIDASLSSGIVSGVSLAILALLIENMEYIEQIINALYHAGIDTLVSSAYVMLGKNF